MNSFASILFWVYLVWVNFDFFQDHSAVVKEPRPYVPLEGTLFKGRLSALGRAETPPMKPVPPSQDKAPRANRKNNPFKMKRKRVNPSKSAQMTSLNSESKDPTHRATLDLYEYFDNILKFSPSAYQFSRRLTLGGITLRLLSLDQWQDEFLLKYSIANRESTEFFNQSSTILINGKKAPTLSYVPFSCRKGEKIFGILRFHAKRAQSQKVGILLVESGGRHRRFKIYDIGYLF